MLEVLGGTREPRNAKRDPDNQESCGCSGSIHTDVCRDQSTDRESKASDANYPYLMWAPSSVAGVSIPVSIDVPSTDKIYMRRRSSSMRNM